ncbi:MAG: hypothetical protein ACTSWY_07030 [Promethearchaeota archaeon]
MSDDYTKKVLIALKQRMSEIKNNIEEGESLNESGENYYSNPNSGYEANTSQVVELLRENIINIKEKIETEHEDYEELYQLKQILEEYNEKLTDSLRISRKQNESLNIKIATMNQKKHDFESKEREMNLIVRELQQNINELKKKIQGLEKDNFELTQKNAEITQENLEVSGDNHEFQKRVAELEDEYFNINEKNLKLQKEYDKKEDEYNKLYDRVKSIEEHVDENDGDYSKIEEENMILGEALLGIEKNMNSYKLSMKQFFQFVKKDLPKKSIYKVLFALIENSSLRVKDFNELINITTSTVYSDIKILENMGIVNVKRGDTKRYSSYLVSLTTNEE